MYQLAILVALGAAAGWVAAHFLLIGWRRMRGKRALPVTGALTRLAGMGLFLSAAGLAGTGFYGSLGAFPQPLGGRLLLAHVALGGGFSVLLLVFALRWAEASRPGALSIQSGPGARFWFWILLAAGMGAILTIMLGMTPLFGQAGLRRLIETHRWTSLAATLAALVHFYLRCLPPPPETNV